MNVEAFSTESLPRGNTVQVWRNAVRRLAALNFDTSPRGLDPFHASMQVCFLGELRLSTVQISPVSSSHQPGAGLRNGAGACYLISNKKEGSSFVAQDGRETTVNSGDFVVIDTSRPFQIKTNGMRTNTLEIPLGTMQAILPEVEGLTAVCISGHSGAGSILRTALDDVFSQSGRINGQASDFIADAIPYLTAAALAELPRVDHFLPGRIESYHRYRIRNFARSNLKRHDLDPEMIARSVGLSLRYVHQLFADEPSTLMQWIWSERISRCAEDFARPALRGRTIEQIAYSWGFNNPAHFSRSFRKSLGTSPRAFRQANAER
jgi:AraC family transcriptional regulator, positive regulator of tynA and feaB